MAISKKIRFEVFKRDGFVCQYCGKHPPEAIMEVDHIKPKARNGKDSINNLITSCFDCNRGKGKIELKQIPNTLHENYDILKEKEHQYLQYMKLVSKIEKRILNEIEQVANIFESHFETVTLTDNFKNTTLKMFIKKLNIIEVMEGMKLACGHFPYLNKFPGYIDSKYCNDVVKYFCGICWNKIKNYE